MIVEILYWFLLSLALAGLEVEAEGKYGWAEKMPTWYRTKGIAARIYGLLLGGKPLTGYHSWMFVLPLIIVHAGFASGEPWSMANEAKALANYFMMAVAWDFLWFVINPHYGITRFRKENVWWHAGSPWLFNRLPLDYLTGWAVSIALAWISNLLGNTNALQEHLLILCGQVALISFTIMIAPLYHNWYRKMRKHDDRSSAPIFHKH